MSTVRLTADVARQVRTRIVVEAGEVTVEFYGARRTALETLTLNAEEAAELADELAAAAREAAFLDDDEDDE